MSAIITIAFDDLINIYTAGDKFGLPVHAPNFDRLADMGMSFEAAYTPVAVCNPARAAALSGLSPFRTGLHNTNDRQWQDVMAPEQTLVGMFQEAGWATYGSGKVYHNSATPSAAPIFDALYTDHFQSHPRTSPRLDNNPIAEPLQPGEVMRDDPNVAWAIDQLNAYDGSEDMLLTLGIIKPHKPFIAPQEYFDLYPQDRLRIPVQPGDLDQVSDFYKEYRLQDSYQDFLDRNGLTLDFIQGYLAALSYADAKLGEVLDAIEANDALDDARIVVWSDHGYELGEKYTWNKFTLWEEAANIPFIVVDPDLPGGSVNPTPVSLLDLTPTLLDMAGIAPPEAGFDGASILPLIDAPDTGRPAVTSMLGSLSIRSGEHRLIHYNDGSVELYNIVRDPEQRFNEALLPEQAWFVAEMLGRLETEVARQGGIFDPDAGQIVGTAGADTLFVTGAQGAVGGGGDDIYLATRGATIVEQAGGGEDRVIFATPEFHIPDNVEFVTNSLYFNTPGVTVFGNAQDNFISIKSTPGEVHVGGGNNTVTGSGTQDRLNGAGGNDHLSGEGGDDIIGGNGGDDTLIGGLGDDSIDGGGGWDRVEYRTLRDSAQIQADADGIHVSLRSAPEQGRDLITGVEELRFFRAETVDATVFSGVFELSEPSLNALVELYVAYFNRAPDARGLHFWADQHANGMSLDTIAAFFFDQPETRALYDTATDPEAFIEAVYQNVLGRAPDDVGRAFWLDALQSGGVEEAGFVRALLDGARAEGGGVGDAEYLAHKTDLGGYFALTRGLDHVGRAKAAMNRFEGGEASLRDVRDFIDRQYSNTLNDPEGGLIIEMLGFLPDTFNQLS